MQIMKVNDALNCSRICEGKVFYYSLREDGVVIKTSKKHYKESTNNPYLKRGKAYIKINRKEYTLKNLVAFHFVPGYRRGDLVEVIDGNPLNCAAWNLRVYSKSEHGRRTGHRSKSQKVIADGIEYRSVRECAKALYVSYQTLLDYMDGTTKHSVLKGKNIARSEECGTNEYA